ncbi:hypothetical protein MRB53_035863 [Persea americana]|uniref:Uncharacterized protein n=1 Tax=Persea americana TaxID=3435 RepID=A0ACC2K640_PERAE|nr:hypothetical protein MRB53_035863 [Persea americana]
MPFKKPSPLEKPAPNPNPNHKWADNQDATRPPLSLSGRSNPNPREESSRRLQGRRSDLSPVRFTPPLFPVPPKLPRLQALARPPRPPPLLPLAPRPALPRLREPHLPLPRPHRDRPRHHLHPLPVPSQQLRHLPHPPTSPSLLISQKNPSQTQTSLVCSERTFSSLDAFFSPSLATKINKSVSSSSPRLVWAGVASSPIFASSPSSATYLAGNPLTKVRFFCLLLNLLECEQRSQEYFKEQSAFRRQKERKEKYNLYKELVDADAVALYRGLE